MRIILSVLMIAHGFIHLLGFVKAMKPSAVEQLTQHISRPMGVLWLIGALLFMTAGMLLLSRHEAWRWAVIPALMLSQLLIISSWSDARYGTIANVIILLPLIYANLTHAGY